MEPLSTFGIPVAKAIMSQVGKHAGAAVLTKLSGLREQKALERALEQAFATVEQTHGHRLAEFDVNPGFLEHEGAPELAKAITLEAEPSATRLAELCVDSLGRAPSDDVRWDRIAALRPVFVTLLEALDTELRRDVALRTLLTRADEMAVAEAATRVAARLGAAGATREDEIHYLRWLIDQNRYIRTAGVVRRMTVQLPLAEVFVGLQAEPDRHPGDRARMWFEREHEKLAARLRSGELDQVAFEAGLDRLEIEYGRKFPLESRDRADGRLPVLTAAATTQHLLVLGDPGSGKTTLLRYLGLRHAQALLRGEMVSGQQALFPLYLRIGDYARTPHPRAGIGDFIADYLRGLECRVTGLDDLLRSKLEGGRCLVMMDGLDEIASADQRRAVVTAVSNFVTANTRQGNRFVVTSRISGYLAAPLPDPFQAVRLQEMNDETIERFLHFYCREVERAETPDKSSSAIAVSGDREATAIGEALRGNAGVRRLAANPLLLTALVLVHRASGRLPHRRVEAYVEVCNALGRTWRSVQGVAEADLPDDRIVNLWLTDLGAWIHEQRPEGAASKRELLQVLGPLWAEHHGVAWDSAVLAAADPMGTDAGVGVMEFVDKADRHTGLLVERAPGRYGFAHLTFEEYYTGRALAFRGAATDRAAAIRGRLHDPRYDEPILLALGLIGTDYAEQIESVVAEAIYPASGSPSPYEHLLGRDFLFLLRVLADDIPVGTTTIDGLLNLAAEELFGSPTSRARFDTYRRALYARLAALGTTKAGGRLQNVVQDRLAEHSYLKPGEFCRLAAAAARCGPLPESVLRRLLEVANGELRHGAPTAVQALATNPDPPVFVVDGLVALAVTASETSIQIAAARGLAVMGRLSEPVIEAMLTLSTMSPFDRTQIGAIEALTAGHPLPEEVIDAVAALAEDAKNVEPSVRGAAVRHLAVGDVPSDPQVTALTRLAATSQSWEIRIAALQALVGVGLRPASVVTAWITVVEKETTLPVVRAQALHTLASSGPLSTELTTIAIDLAVGNHPTAVRMDALRALGLSRELQRPAVVALAGLATFPSTPPNQGYPTIRVEAVRVLAAASALTQEVILKLLQLAAPEVPQEVRVDALNALAEAKELPGPVSTALVRLVAGESEQSDEVRQAALRSLRSANTLPDDVLASMSALTRDRAQPSSIRIRAATVLARFGQAAGGPADQVAQLATSADLINQASALQLLASAGVVTGGMIPALIRLATENTESSLRARATEALATAPEMTDDLMNALVRIATTDADYSIRLIAVRALRKAHAGPDVRAALMSRLLDDDNDVRRTAGDTLVSLARQHPDAAPTIESALAEACEDPAFAKVELIGGLSGWDYAYNALQTHLDVKDRVS